MSNRNQAIIFTADSIGIAQSFHKQSRYCCLFRKHFQAPYSNRVNIFLDTKFDIIREYALDCSIFYLTTVKECVIWFSFKERCDDWGIYINEFSLYCFVKMMHMVQRR